MFRLLRQHTRGNVYTFHTVAPPARTARALARCCHGIQAQPAGPMRCGKKQVLRCRILARRYVCYRSFSNAPCCLSNAVLLFQCVQLIDKPRVLRLIFWRCGLTTNNTNSLLKRADFVHSWLVVVDDRRRLLPCEILLVFPSLAQRLTHVATIQISVTRALVAFATDC